MENGEYYELIIAFCFHGNDRCLNVNEIGNSIVLYIFANYAWNMRPNDKCHGELLEIDSYICYASLTVR